MSAFMFAVEAPVGRKAEPKINSGPTPKCSSPSFEAWLDWRLAGPGGGVPLFDTD
jgi:hypothetical protein